MHTVGNTMHTAQRLQGAMHPINWITSNGILTAHIPKIMQVYLPSHP